VEAELASSAKHGWVEVAGQPLEGRRASQE